MASGTVSKYPADAMPDQQALLYDSITAAMAAGDSNRAVGLATQLIKQHPSFQPGLVLFSQLMVEIGRNALALDWARKAVALDTTNTRAMLQLSRAYHAAGFLQQAIQAAQRASDLVGEDPDECSSLGTVFFHLGDFDAAAQAHQRAIDMQPERVVYWYNLGVTSQAAGRLEQAEQLFLRVIELDPDNTEAFMNLSRIRKQSKDSNHIPQLEQALRGAAGNTEKCVRLHYSLAKEYEDVGDFPESFAHLARGAELHRGTMDYSVSVETEFVDRLIRCFPPGCFEDYEGGCASDEPIFIVGMPRSGTTLTEQIIAAHSEVFAAGELRDFNMNLSLQADIRGSVAELDEGTLRRLLAGDAARMGENYIERTRPRTGHTPHFIDKLPRNSHLCGFIHWALPNARIILLDRHPVDVCFSNFKVLFKQGYNYSYKLEEIADYYIAYHRLMNHWEKVIPKDRFYRVSYESLVANQEAESRKLISYCGLQWQDACLEYYNNAEGVTTASLAQVRQPIYRSAVARWRNYESELRPLIERLESAGINCN